jgi:tRNA nucleotidyltransferase (CCA-adding enzyme)
MTRNSLALATLFAVAAFAFTPADAQVYKCVEGGRTIYSQTPCASSSRSTTISKTAPSAPPPGAATSGGPQTAAEQEQAFRKRQQEQQEAAKKQSQKAAEAKEKQENCSTARSQLAQYEIGGRITRFDEKGERSYLSDAEIDQEKARARVEVDRWCR